MDRHVTPTAIAAQRAAILEVRTRYERGELTYDTFRRALDALTLAHDADECQVILDALPTSPLLAFSAFEGQLPPIPEPATVLERQRITAFMSQVKKVRRPWKLGAETQATSVMGELTLDLRLAELPPRATLRLTAFMASATIYVPRSARVAVHSSVIMGSVQAIGETINGVVVSGEDEHLPVPGSAAPILDIAVRCVMSDVRIVLVDEKPEVSVTELVRDALRAVALGVQRGLREGARPYPSLPVSERWRNEQQPGR